MPFPIVSMTVHREHDVVEVRQRARHIAGLLGFDAQNQTRIATAVSEIVRNALLYASGGRVEFGIDGSRAPQTFCISVIDKGQGIARVDDILQGRYVSSTGMGLGIVGSRRLMDEFRIESSPGGTTVRMGKLLPARAQPLKGTDARRVADALAAAKPLTTEAELQQQNQELLRTLDELRRRQEELSRLNAELEDTNRGVVALYAELDERADSLRRADDMKSRFLSNMSHEFRTPLNSIRALSQILLERTDGELAAEQEVQVSLIKRAAEDLTELVNDLLDLAKVEAGKVVVRPAECDVHRLFGALRGMLRPLIAGDAIALIFDEVPADFPILFTDESKVSQILRNFISNAVKFTDRGHVRVSAGRGEGDTVVFTVEDTGIGIAPEDQPRIFQEFGQIDHPVQSKVRGTGLGLPLSQKLAQLLGGIIRVESQLGVGSIFSLVLPLAYRDVSAESVVSAPPAIRSAAATRTRRRILVVDDDDAARYLVRKWLTEADYEVLEESTGNGASAAARNHAPDVIVLDLKMPDASGFEVLQQLADDPATHDIPIVVHTSLVDAPARERLGEHVVEVVSKNQVAAEEAATLRAAVERAANFARF